MRECARIGHLSTGLVIDAALLIIPLFPARNVKPQEPGRGDAKSENIIRIVPLI